MAGETGQDSTLALALAATTALTTGVVDAPKPATPAAAAAPAPEPETAPALAPVVEDVDDIELREAQAAAKAEEAPAATPAQPANTAQPAPAPAAASSEKPKDQPEQQSGVMIPKARLDEVLGKNDELVKQNAFLAGQLEAHKAAGARPAPAAAPPSPAAAPQPTAADRLLEVGARQDALAARFDKGEIGYAELKREERKLEDEAYKIREEITLSKVQPAQPQAPSAASDLYLDQLTAELESKHPYILEITNDRDFNWLHAKAVEELQAEGQFVQSPLGNYRLRERIAVLSDKYGELLTGKKLALPGTQLAPAPSTQPATTQPAPSAEAAARAAKIAMQAGMPPNVASMTGTSGDVVSEAAYETMTDDEIAALPAATRHRFLGITA